jgi:hypothetical protein
MLLYTGYAAVTWYRYGRTGSEAAESAGDALLDRFVPVYEVAERHEIRVAAPASITYAAAREVDLNRSPLVRAIFRGRELLMRAPKGEASSQPFLDQVLAIGWGVLAEEPGREIVLGAVTQPWQSEVHFHALPPSAFAAFHEPGYAKIVWTLSVQPIGPTRSVFRTETRVATTDAESRSRFRRYWAVFSPGIILIRRATLHLVKDEAERRVPGAARRS